MNNEQFRKLMLASSAKLERDNNGQAPAERTSSSAGVGLGSRQRTSAPMKPYVHLDKLSTQLIVF